MYLNIDFSTVEQMDLPEFFIENALKKYELENISNIFYIIL
jgi:hypothetical protein